MRFHGNLVIDAAGEYRRGVAADTDRYCRSQGNIPTGILDRVREAVAECFAAIMMVFKGAVCIDDHRAIQWQLLQTGHENAHRLVQINSALQQALCTRIEIVQNLSTSARQLMIRRFRRFIVNRRYRKQQALDRQFGGSIRHRDAETSFLRRLRSIVIEHYLVCQQVCVSETIADNFIDDQCARLQVADDIDYIAMGSIIIFHAEMLGLQGQQVTFLYLHVRHWLNDRWIIDIADRDLEDQPRQLSGFILECEGEAVGPVVLHTHMVALVLVDHQLVNQILLGEARTDTAIDP